MALKRLNNAKKSFYEYIKWVLETGTSYTIGEASGNLRVLESYPLLPTGLVLPTVAIDIERIGLRKEYDLGKDAYYEYEFGIEIYGQNNFDKEYLVETITDRIENDGITFFDYNSVCHQISMLEVTGYDGGPIRVLEPTEEEKYKFGLTINLRALLDYSN